MIAAANRLPLQRHIAPPPSGSGFSLKYFEVRRYGVTATSTTGNTRVQVGALQGVQQILIRQILPSAKRRLRHATTYLITFADSMGILAPRRRGRTTPRSTARLPTPRLAPNVMILFDTSGSMSTEDVPGDPYDPTTDLQRQLQLLCQCGLYRRLERTYELRVDSCSPAPSTTSPATRSRPSCSRSATSGRQDPGQQFHLRGSTTASTVCGWAIT